MGFIAPAISAIGGLFSGGAGLGLLGLGAAALSYMGASKAGQGQGVNQSALLNLQNANNTALDNLPEVPTAPTNDPADNSAAEEARRKELAAIAAAEQQNMVNPTGGLGVPGQANTQKKQLLGI